MVSCWACKNRSTQGYTMYRFPRDPDLRDKWFQMTRRSQPPNDNARLCHVHFESNQYEQRRIDGRKRLVHQAIPTLFTFPPKAHRIGNSKKVADDSTEDNKDMNEEKGAVSDAPADPVPTRTTAAEAKNGKTPASIAARSSKPIKKIIHVDRICLSTLRTKNVGTSCCESTAEKAESLRKEINIAKQKARRAEDILNQQQLQLTTLFNADQLEALTRSSTQGLKWHLDTINRANELFAVCGLKGYEKLLEHGYPLPALRTIRRADVNRLKAVRVDVEKTFVQE
ncbi:uncharacterized protein [Watersipora subatra]|uniref:uncharacterized protein n=1 Tax=Watersipora subatra TaxID=2589382 RepID=UPI00355C2C9B